MMEKTKVNVTYLSERDFLWLWNLFWSGCLNTQLLIDNKKTMELCPDIWLRIPANKSISIVTSCSDVKVGKIWSKYFLYLIDHWTRRLQKQILNKQIVFSVKSPYLHSLKYPNWLTISSATVSPPHERYGLHPARPHPTLLTWIFQIQPPSYHDHTQYALG